MPQGLHATFVATAAIVVFGLGEAIHASGFLAVYLAGLIVGNRRRARIDASCVPRRRDLARADRDVRAVRPAGLARRGCRRWRCRRSRSRSTLMLIARPAAVFLCLCAVPVFVPRESVHLLGRLARRGRHLPRVDSAPGRLPKAQIYFDIGFVVVLVSLLVQGWTLRFAARALHIAKPRRRSHPRASSSICRASARRSWSATRLLRAVLICAAGSSRPGPS